jgi:hypothetical protein
MAFQSKDGKSFGSKFVAKRRDSEHDKMGKAVMGATSPAAEKAPVAPSVFGADKAAAPAAPEQDQQQQQQPQEDPKQVVAQHGAATTVHIAHDNKAKKHHVVSTHKDGHVHESEHGDAKSAHDAGSQLSGSGDQPMAGEPGAAPAGPEPDGFSMPRLA